LLQRIGEFQSFNFHAEGASQILLTVAVAMIAAPLTLARRRPAHFLVILALVAMALQSARALPLVALLALPLAAGAITEAVEWSTLRAPLRARLDQFVLYCLRLRRIDATCGGWVWAPLVIAGCVTLLRTEAFSPTAGFSVTEFPVDAGAAVADLP